MPDTAVRLKFKKIIKSDRADAMGLIDEAVAYLEILKSSGRATCVNEYFFRLSLDEALENAIIHGNRGDYQREILVLILSYGKGVAISVRDEGCGYFPGDLKDPRDRENLYKKSGRGVHILKNIAAVSWNLRGNCVTIRL